MEGRRHEEMFKVRHRCYLEVYYGEESRDRRRWRERGESSRLKATCPHAVAATVMLIIIFDDAFSPLFSPSSDAFIDAIIAAATP